MYVRGPRLRGWGEFRPRGNRHKSAETWQRVAVARHSFRVILTGSETGSVRGKPDPQVFTQATRKEKCHGRQSSGGKQASPRAPTATRRARPRAGRRKKSRRAAQEADTQPSQGKIQLGAETLPLEPRPLGEGA